MHKRLLLLHCHLLQRKRVVCSAKLIMSKSTMPSTCMLFWEKILLKVEHKKQLPKNRDKVLASFWGVVPPPECAVTMKYCRYVSQGQWNVGRAGLLSQTCIACQTGALENIGHFGEEMSHQIPLYQSVISMFCWHFLQFLLHRFASRLREALLNAAGVASPSCVHNSVMTSYE